MCGIWCIRSNSWSFFKWLSIHRLKVWAVNHGRIVMLQGSQGSNGCRHREAFLMVSVREEALIPYHHLPSFQISKSERCHHSHILASILVVCFKLKLMDCARRGRYGLACLHVVLLELSAWKLSQILQQTASFSVSNISQQGGGFQAKWSQTI